MTINASIIINIIVITCHIHRKYCITIRYFTYRTHENDNRNDYNNNGDDDNRNDYNNNGDDDNRNDYGDDDNRNDYNNNGDDDNYVNDIIKLKNN